VGHHIFASGAVRYGRIPHYPEEASLGIHVHSQGLT
jgi:hypothetical protein